MPLRAGLEEQRDVEEDDRRIAVGRGEGGAIGSDERVDAGFDLGQQPRLGRNRVA